VKNSLAEMVSAAKLTQLGIDPSARAEDLAVASFVAITNSLHEAGPR
jgi:16S rRNA A1518/A1519 N6-dimethyltransferase RsmA/KsgA/DIM1 with predicted DNA glycosylase/AP lyase activity